MLRNLNLILKRIEWHVVIIHDSHIEFATLFVFRSRRDAFVISSDTKKLMVEVIQDSDSLRSALRNTTWDDLPISIIDPPTIPWAKALMEILLFEMESFPALYEQADVDESYRSKCVRCLRRLSRRFSILPPSYFVCNVVTEGKRGITGGGFADIWHGRMDGRLVCVKVLRFYTSLTSAERAKLIQNFCREALCWGYLEHPNILPFLGVDEEMFNPSFCLISPWMDNGNLMSFLANLPENRAFDRLTAVIDTAQGMRYLHECDPPIVHADIRGANILVTSQCRCCLADFGLSSATEMTLSSLRSDGATAWMAPEILGDLTVPSPPRDIYAFGCTVLEIFSGKRPFHELVLPAVPAQVIAGERPKRPARGSTPQEITDKLWSVITSCWRRDVMARPSAKEILHELSVPPPPSYTVLRRPAREITEEALMNKLRSIGQGIYCAIDALAGRIPQP
ncbi:kinase-like domain-containing protein [Mycena crocata]|nr:kinase-like domain-containing protein [Mycena crocata]